MIVRLAEIALFLTALIGMEGFAWIMHRYVMHGAMWCWHRSHHVKGRGVLELNDLFAVVFAAPAIVCIWLGLHVSVWFLPIGLGITAYGIIYAVSHDGLIHGRFWTPINGRRGYWRSLVQAHRIHHAVGTKKGCVSFGFLLVRPVRELKAELSSIQCSTCDKPKQSGLRRRAG